MKLASCQIFSRAARAVRPPFHEASQIRCRLPTGVDSPVRGGIRPERSRPTTPTAGADRKQATTTSLRRKQRRSRRRTCDFRCGQRRQGVRLSGRYRDYVSVTAFSPDYLPAYCTNYGPGCNVAAPGGDAYLALGSSAAQVLSTLPSELYQSDYGYMQGTSMACPHVSGVAALGLSCSAGQGSNIRWPNSNRCF